MQSKKEFNFVSYSNLFQEEEVAKKEEAAYKEKMVVRQNPTLLHTPDPFQQLPSLTQALAANENETHDVSHFPVYLLFLNIFTDILVMSISILF